MIQFVVPLLPQSKQRPRTAVVAGHARVFTPAATVQAEREFVALAAPWAPGVPLQCPVAIKLVFVLPIPASWPLWKRRAAVALCVCPRGPKDVDNLAKLALDAMTRSGRWWVDDAQVVSLWAVKVYGDRPETRVRIERVSDPGTRDWTATLEHLSEL